MAKLIEPGKIQRALNIVQSMVAGVDGLTQTAQKIGELAAKIGGYLGLRRANVLNVARPCRDPAEHW